MDRGPGALTAAQARTLLAHRLDSKPPGDAVAFDLRAALADILPRVFAAYVEEMTRGKGVARIAACDRLREMADAEGIGTDRESATDVSFFDVACDEAGKIVPIKSA